jgi:hypothetical protein
MIIEKQIRQIKDELDSMGPMRPGSLTRQYKRPKAKEGAYCQLSYTHKMRSRTEYVRPEFVDGIRQQIAVYRRFKALEAAGIDIQERQIIWPDGDRLTIDHTAQKIHNQTGTDIESIKKILHDSIPAYRRAVLLDS